MTFVVAMDGPAGTGKSSVARLLAEKLNFIYFDTGLIYRGLAFLAVKNGVNPKDPEALLKLIPQMIFKTDELSFAVNLLVDGKSLEQELRTEEMSRLSSVVSQFPEVRQKLLGVQRSLAKTDKKGALFLGRDIATVVLPKAPLKIFLTASAETRAQRRFDELKKNEPNTNFLDILEGIKRRDERDLSREAAPMQCAKDAHKIDSSDLSLSEVTEIIFKLIKKAQKSYEGGSLW